MNKITPPKFFKKLSKPYVRGFSSFLLMCAAAAVTSVSAQTSYSLTTGGSTGPNPPSTGALTSAYANTSLNGLVTSVNGMQSFTVPHTGVYQITAIGAQGGYNGGHGASISGNFTLTTGTVLKILVGQQGTQDNNGQFNAGGGGGGSFVTDNSNNIMVIAGGGGGNGDGYGGVPVLCCSSTMESTINNNGNPYPNGSNGGSGGNGGTCGFSNAGTGAGFSGNGSSCNSGGASFSFLNGGAAGLGNNLTGDGGFGGGGGCYNSGTGQRGGGGGGYSGGGGGYATNGNEPNAAGGGGGSYNTGSNQANSISTHAGDGMVVIKDLCNLNLTSTSNPMCVGGSATLTTNAISNISWSPGGSTANSIVVSPSGTTSYTVTGKGSAAECMGTIRTNVITVSISPLPVVSGMVTPSVLCIGATATITGMGANSYSWSTGTQGGTTTVSPDVTTVYNVTATSVFGCKNTGVVTVNVNTNVLGGTPNSTVCKGKSITLNATGGSSYLWNSVLPFPSIVVTPTASTVYTVNAVDAIGCTLSHTISVGVNALPAIQATSDKNVVCPGEAFVLTASGANTYTWSNNSNAAMITITPSVNVVYTYTVTGTDNNGCQGVKTVSVLVSKCAGITENTNSSAVKIFPNPANGMFVVSVSDFSENVNINVFNALGSLIKTQKANAADSEINIQQEPNGIYFVHLVKDGKTIQVTKVVKQ